MNRIVVSLCVPLALSAMLPAQTPSATPAAVKPPAAHTTPKTAAPKTAAAAPALTTDDQKTIYALGVSMYQSLSGFELSPAELQIVKRAFADAAAGKPAIDVAPWQPKIGPLKNARAQVSAGKRKAASQAFLAKAGAVPGAVKTDSGLIYKELRPGTGSSPAATDTVKVNYRGTFIDGTEFDSSYKTHAPVSFPLNHVIKCWTEGVQKMKVGGKAGLVCPSDLAYGDGGRPSIPGGSTLVFEIELLEIVPPAK